MSQDKERMAIAYRLGSEELKRQVTEAPGWYAGITAWSYT